jgi:hypothetical protein
LRRRETPHDHGESKQSKRPAKRRRPPVTQRFRSRGVDVEIRQDTDRVELALDGISIPVTIIDGQFHSQIANQFTAFDSLDDIVETLLANEGRTWTLHGNLRSGSTDPQGRGQPGHEHGEAGHEMP